MFADNFDRADAMSVGEWGASSKWTTLYDSERLGSGRDDTVLVASVIANDSDSGVVIPAMNTWPALPVPAGAQQGDRVRWTIVDGEVVATEILAD